MLTRELYIIQFYDNDTYLLKKNSDVICVNCNMYLNKEKLIRQFIHNYKAKKRKYHFLATYDGFHIVSHQFKILYDTQKWEGLVFHEIPKNKGLYYIIECVNLISYDINCLMAEEHCSECKQYKSVVVKDRRRIVPKKTLLKNTFYRTDWQFGYDFEQNHMLFCSEEIMHTIIEHKLAKRIDFLVMLQMSC